jgi:cold shock CspA family protein
MKTSKEKLGYVQWFDDSSGEGSICCPIDNCCYYVHWSAIKYGPEGAKTLEKFQPVKFSLYENLYMKQVDSIQPLNFDFNVKDEHKLQQLMNDAWETLDTNVFKIADKYFKES